ncbi:MAG: flagellar hook-length control protein FliK [Myxococcaceae bacterium]|nr:flagellar hook-length control protein FliK [Myxococcaceae bacterium]
MSRIDESDRQAQRIAEKLALEKRQAEDRAKQARQGESRFARLIQQSDAQRTRQQQGAAAQYLQAAHEDKTEAGSIVGEAIALASESEGRIFQDASRAKQTLRSFGERLKSAQAGEGERASESRLGDAGRDALSALGRNLDAHTQDLRAESRREDARLGRQALGERGDASLSKSAAAGAGRGGPVGETKTDADGGGGKGSGGEKKDQGGTPTGAGFRFNPALMAPVPVAKARETPASDRLRQIANEIAQKIVERVRVGTNAAGAAEFQIDLRSNVLSGLSIKVSGGKGRIRLVFSGADKEVLKALGEGAESLKQALGGRGLSVEELRIEERA